MSRRRALPLARLTAYRTATSMNWTASPRRCTSPPMVSAVDCSGAAVDKADFPTDDVLKARLKTTGVVEHSFTLTSAEFRGVEWKIYDVGGARHQRHAWAPYFDDGASCSSRS